MNKTAYTGVSLPRWGGRQTDDSGTRQNGGNDAAAPGHRADHIPTVLSPAGHVILPTPPPRPLPPTFERCFYSHFLSEKNRDPEPLNTCQAHIFVSGRAGVQTQHCNPVPP